MSIDRYLAVAYSTKAHQVNLCMLFCGGLKDCSTVARAIADKIQTHDRVKNNLFCNLIEIVLLFRKLYLYKQRISEFV